MREGIFTVIRSLSNILKNRRRVLLSIFTIAVVVGVVFENVVYGTTGMDFLFKYNSIADSQRKDNPILFKKFSVTSNHSNVLGSYYCIGGVKKIFSLTKTIKEISLTGEWNTTFGGSAADAGYSVQQTTDGGYIIAGYTRSYGYGDKDVLLIKTDRNGNFEWGCVYGGSAADAGYSVQQTTDGGYIIAGYTRSYGYGGSDVWVIKTNSTGYPVWGLGFGGQWDDTSYSVQQTTDGGYIITGYVTIGYPFYDKDILLLKVGPEGNLQWYKVYSNFGDDKGYSVQQTTDGGYIITGYVATMTLYEICLIKTFPDGGVEWSKTFGFGPYNKGYSVQQTTDGGYIITGYGGSYSGGEFNIDVWLIKTGSDGNTEWIKKFGGSANDYGRSVQQTTDGGYIIAGYTYSYGAGNSDVWLIKTGPNGDTEWSKTFGGSAADAGYSVQQTTDGGYIIAGYTYSYGAGNSDVWLIKTIPKYLPDLSISLDDITFSKPYIKEGDIVTISATIHNIGNASATNIVVKFFEKVNNRWTQIGMDQIISCIFPNSYANVSVTWIPQFGEIRSIKIVVDPDNEIYEEKENNNEVIKNIFVQQIIRLIPAIEYNKTSKTADISVWAYNTLTGIVTTGNGTWEIYHDNNLTGLSGTLAYNASSFYWEALNIDLSTLNIGYYSVRINISSGNVYGEGKLSFAILSGYCTIRGIVKEKITGNPIENASVTLYRRGFSKYDSTTTNINGEYSFDFIEPGVYLIQVLKDGYVQSFRLVFVPSDIIKFVNFSLAKTGSAITSMIKNLYNQSCDSLECLADKMGYVTETYPNLVIDEPDILDVIGFAGDILSGYVIPAAVEAHKSIIGSKQAFYVLWGWMIKEAKKEIIKESKEVIAKEAIKLIPLFINKNLDLPNTEEIKNTTFYTNIQEFLNSEYTKFINHMNSINVSSYLDIYKVQSLIATEIQQLENINKTNTVIISVDPKSPHIYLYFIFPASYDSYNRAKTILKKLGSAGKIVTAVHAAVAGGGVVAIVLTGGAAAPVVAQIVKALTAIKKSIEAAEIDAKCWTTMTFISAFLSWIKDSSNIPLLFNQTVSLIKEETVMPYYLNKSNCFTATIKNIDIHEDFEFFGIKFLWVPFFVSLRNADITVKNTGNDSWIRIVAGRSLGKPKYVSHNEVTVWGIPFWVYHVPVVDLFRDKWFKIDIYSGVNPYSIDHKEVRYRTTAVRWWLKKDRGGTADFKATTSKGPLTLSQYVTYSSRTSKILDVNLTTQNHTTELYYTVSSNSSDVKFTLFYPSNSRVDLHIYDMKGHHVGFDYASWKEEIGFPATYNGFGSNPQIISIPGATGKTFHIVIKLGMAFSENETYHVTMYVSEDPFRPAVMAAEPTEIIMVGNVNQTISIPFFCGEAGGQHPLYNVTIEISNISNGNMSLRLLTPQNYTIDAILAGTTAGIPIKVFIPPTIPEGNYTGKVIVNASNAQKILANITIIVDITPPSVTPNPTIYPAGQQFAKINDTVTLNVTVDDNTKIISVSVNVSAISNQGSVMLFAGNSGYYKGNVTIDKNVSNGIYYLQIWAMDAAGNINNTMNVSVRIGTEIDTTPPTTTKTIGNPKYGMNDEWVTTHAPIWLNSTDNINGSGVNYTHYEIWWDQDGDGIVDMLVENVTVYDNDGNDLDPSIGNISIKFSLNEECLHELKWYSVDNAENVEEVHTQIHYVDNSSPETTISFGTPYYESGGNHWITTSTPIYLDAVDYPDCAVGVEAIYYRINGGDWQEYTGAFTIDEECSHTIEYYAMDYLGNEEEHHIITVNVDDSPPITSIEFGTPYHYDGNHWVTTATPIYLNASDEPYCGCGVNKTYYRIIAPDYTTIWYEYTEPFYLLEECEHIIEYYSIDHLGNVENVKSIAVYVDEGIPSINISVGEPSQKVGDIYYVKNNTIISIYANDTGCNDGAGIESIYYRIWYNGSWTPWTMYARGISFEGEGLHYLEVNATDYLENSYIANYTFYVDLNPPYSWLIVDLGVWEKYITPYSEFTIFAGDDEVGLYIIRFRIEGPENSKFYWKGKYYPCNGTWHEDVVPIAFQIRDEKGFAPNGIYTVRFYAIDILGNVEEEMHKETFKIDLDPPETTMSFDGKVYNDYISSSTKIILNAHDLSGIKYTKYRIDDGEWKYYTEPFNVATEGEHIIYYYSKDNMGNKEDIKEYTLYVDNTPPESNIVFNGKNVENNGIVWLSLDTLIEIEANDNVGISKIYYCIDDGRWQEYTTPFKLNGNVSLIKYYAEDMLGNREDINSIKIGIDDMPPEIIVMKPKAYLYIAGREIIPLSGKLNIDAVIIGSAKIEAMARDESGINSMDIYMDEKLVYEGNAHIEYIWNKFSIGKHIITIEASDKLGYKSSETIKAIIINPLPF